MVHDDLVITKLFKVFMAELESLARNLSRDAYAFQAASMILTLRLLNWIWHAYYPFLRLCGQERIVIAPLG